MTKLQEKPLCLLKRLSLWGAEGQRPRRWAKNKQTKKGDDYEIFFSFTINKWLEKQEVWLCSAEWHIYAMQQSPEIKRW